MMVSPLPLLLTLKQYAQSLASPVVVTFARRTPLQRARKGQYKDMSVQELLLEYFRVRFPRSPLLRLELIQIRLMYRNLSQR